MRDLVDTATWDDDLDSLGPEVGDPANGEEISVIGDKLASRTRYLLARVDGAKRMQDLAYAYTTSTGTILTVSTTTYDDALSLATGVAVLTGDILEVTSQVHVSKIVLPGVGAQGMRLAHRWNSTPGGSPTINAVAAYRRVFLEDTEVSALHVTITDYILVTRGMNALPATLTLAARLDATETSAHAVKGPSAMSIKIWRANGSI